MQVKLIQLPVPDVQATYREGNIPLAAAYLKARVLAADFSFPLSIEIMPRELADFGGDEALLRWILNESPDVVGLTCYMWNVERSLHLAQQIRVRAPETRIVLGGPEISPDSPLLEDAEHTLVFGEGETAFCNFLNYLHEGRAENRYLCGKPEDLSTVPNPYLSGVLRPVPGEMVMLETMRGCPYRCQYCLYSKNFQGLRYFPETQISRIFELARNYRAGEIYLMDPSFNLTPMLETRLQQLAAENVTSVPLHTEIRLESVTPRIAMLMKKAGFRSVEVGLQSVNPAALKQVGRTWNKKKFVEGAGYLQKAGIAVKTGVIMGLPEDTVSDFAATLEFLADLNLAKDMEIYPLSLLPGTRLRERAAELDISHMQAPPYQVQKTASMSAAELGACISLAENELDIEFFPPMVPHLGREATPYTALIDLRSMTEAQQQNLYKAPEKIAASVTVVFLYNHSLEELKKMSRWLQRYNPFSLVQLVIDVENDFSENWCRRVSDIFWQHSTYFDRAHDMKIDGQQRYSRRVFVLTKNPELAARHLHMPAFCDLVVRFYRELLFSQRHILEQQPLLLVEETIDETERRELFAIYRGFENLLIFTQ